MGDAENTFRLAIMAALAEAVAAGLDFIDLEETMHRVWYGASRGPDGGIFWFGEFETAEAHS